MAQDVVKDYENREFIETVEVAIRKCVDFLNNFHESAKYRLSRVDARLIALERKLDFIEASLENCDPIRRNAKPAPFKGSMFDPEVRQKIISQIQQKRAENQRVFSALVVAPSKSAQKGNFIKPSKQIAKSNSNVNIQSNATSPKAKSKPKVEPKPQPKPKPNPIANVPPVAPVVEPKASPKPKSPKQKSKAKPKSEPKPKPKPEPKPEAQAKPPPVPQPGSVAPPVPKQPPAVPQQPQQPPQPVAAQQPPAVPPQPPQQPPAVPPAAPQPAFAAPQVQAPPVPPQQPMQQPPPQPGQPGAGPPMSKGGGEGEAEPGGMGDNQWPNIAGNQIDILIVEQGYGPFPGPQSAVEIEYIGLLPGGQQFIKHREVIQLGKKQNIKGLEQGITQIKVGSLIKLWIPSRLAYGARGAGKLIPPNADLTFELRLHRIVHQ